MKNTSLAFLFLTLLSISCEQVKYPVVKQYGGAELDRSVSIAEIPYEGFAMAGYTEESGSEDILIIRTDSEGNEIWKKTYGDLGDEAGWSIEHLSGEGFILAGFTTSWGNGENDIFLMRLDVDGNELWKKTYGGSGDDYAWNMKVTSLGNFLVVGQIFDSLTSSTNFYMMLTDTAGSVLWEKMEGDPNARDRAYSVVEDQDGNFVVCGGSQTQGSEDITNIRLAKVDPNGATIWAKVFDTETHDIAHSIVEMNDGNYMTVGYTGRNRQEGNFDALIKKIDKNGNELWTKKYDKDGDNRFITGLKTTAGNCAAIGYSFKPGSPTATHLLLVDGEGALLGEEQFALEGSNTGYDLIESKSGEFAITGHFENDSTRNRDALFIKSDLGKKIKKQWHYE